jgi:[acyl-carrier-protein] S-malonyltransferase
VIAWVFPGQGSQLRGMGARLSSDAAMETFDTARRVLGWDVRQACIDGPDDRLGRTEISQPAILSVSVAVAESLQAAGHFPDAVAGHSVGEFAALVAAHAITFEEALRAVVARADAMARAGTKRAGGMAAIVGLSPDRVEQACAGAGGIVGIAAINAPSQVVISGEREAVASAGKAARAAGARRVVPLSVSVAAHSPLMKPAERALRTALKAKAFLPPIVPFASCVTGTLVEGSDEIPGLLCDALTRPVLWVEVVRVLDGIGVDRVIEVGPGRVLSGLVRSILPDAQTSAVGEDDAIAGLAGQLAGGRAL